MAHIKLQFLVEIERMMREKLFATNASKALQMVRMLFEQGDRFFVVEVFVTFFTTGEEGEETASGAI